MSERMRGLELPPVAELGLLAALSRLAFLPTVMVASLRQFGIASPWTVGVPMIAAAAAVFVVSVCRFPRARSVLTATAILPMALALGGLIPPVTWAPHGAAWHVAALAAGVALWDLGSRR